MKDLSFLSGLLWTLGLVGMVLGLLGCSGGNRQGVLPQPVKAKAKRAADPGALAPGPSAPGTGPVSDCPLAHDRPCSKPFPLPVRKNGVRLSSVKDIQFPAPSMILLAGAGGAVSRDGGKSWGVREIDQVVCRKTTLDTLGRIWCLGWDYAPYWKGYGALSIVAVSSDEGGSWTAIHAHYPPQSVTLLRTSDGRLAIIDDAGHDRVMLGANLRPWKDWRFSSIEPRMIPQFGQHVEDVLGIEQDRYYLAEGSVWHLAPSGSWTEAKLQATSIGQAAGSVWAASREGKVWRTEPGSENWHLVSSLPAAGRHSLCTNTVPTEAHAFILCENPSHIEEYTSVIPELWRVPIRGKPARVPLPARRKLEALAVSPSGELWAALENDGVYVLRAGQRWRRVLTFGNNGGIRAQ